MVTGRFAPDVLESLRDSVPLGTLGEPEQVAHAIDYLTSPSAAFVTGTVMNISGGVVLD
jgi:NAD(P)-dependent dehydrogenase (short-subunit alcohol dehydrogenase family)